MTQNENSYAHPRWGRLRSLRDRSLRAQRALASRAVRDGLVSGAGLIGRPVRNQAGEEVGRLVEIVVNFSAAGGQEPYPPATGLVIRIGRRRTWVHAEQIALVSHGEVRLNSARLDLRDVVRRPGEVGLAADVLDHQLIDVDGRRVIRAADVLLAPLRDELRVVGVDVSIASLVRRLGPARLRTRPTPDRVIDWAAIQPLSDENRAAGVRLREPVQALTALRPGELADLLEQLGRSERRQLLDSLDTATAAHAVEEMAADDVRTLLHDSEPQVVAELLSEMEPDEAADALRDLPDEERERFLRAMPAEVASRLAALLGYDENRAGGLMTTTLVLCNEHETVREVRAKLRALASHAVDLTAIVIIDGDGRLLDDVTVLELLLAESDTRLAELIGPPWPVTVGPETPLSEVAEQLIENRSASIVVVDADGRPLGRVLADDLVDALVPDKGRLQLFRQAPS
ncbi:MAG TPA: CBS domain-containing protein [Solirubrobacteraceae bacterium]|jgi:CBS domain-containing protein|nr:CBS domain-containing protein [Solirubrobacteraceae bacterium]